MVECGWNGDHKMLADDLDLARCSSITFEIQKKIFADLDHKVLNAVGSENVLWFYKTHHLVIEHEITNDHRYLIKAYYEPKGHQNV
jgi:hypothetical protein